MPVNSAEASCRDRLRSEPGPCAQASEAAEPPLVPSQFNAHTVTSDGTLVVWNSYTNAFSGFPPDARSLVERLLRDGDGGEPPTKLTKYFRDRGFLVPRGTDELSRFRLAFGQAHYRLDRLHLTLLASEDCNFRCVYCYEKFARGTMEPSVRKGVIRLIESRAPTLRSLIISYFGGEPLLGFEAIAEVAPAVQAIARNHGVRLASGMTTNAYLLTPDVFAKLIEWDIRGFQITVDGLPEDHDSRRMLKGGGPTFHRILENLIAMQSLEEDFGVTLRVNFDQASAGRMGEFLSLIDAFKADERFSIFFYPIKKLGGSNDSQLDICDELGPQRNALETLATQMGARVHRTAPTRGVFGDMCYAARPYHVTIGADGRLMKCTVVLDARKSNVVGRLSEDGHMDLDIDRFVRWTSPYFEDDAACRKCFFLPVCQGAECPNARVTEHQRRCPPDKVNIRRSLEKVWILNHGGANRYDLARERVVRGDGSDAVRDLSKGAPRSTSGGHQPHPMSAIRSDHVCALGAQPSRGGDDR